jgi:hypothetical protein
MFRPLRAERYAKDASPVLIRFITDKLPVWDFYETMAWYRETVPRLNGPEMALLGCNDRYFLLTWLLNRRDAIHPWLHERCREVEANPDGSLDLWARFHFKSSIITFAGVIQEVLCDPEIRVCIFSNTNDIAHPFVAQIKEEFEGNEDLIRLYPDVLWQSPAERKAGARSWSVQDGIVVKRQGNPREATIEGHGLINALPTGKHFPLLVYDDVINERNVTNPDQIKKATERMELSFSLGIGGGTRKWYIGTRYSYADTYGYMLDPMRAIAIPRVKPATDDGSLNGCPVFMTPKAWADTKREQRSQVAAQFLQNPLAGKENTFRVGWLKPYWARPSMLNVYILGDPSKGRNRTSDRTALAVVGIDATGNKYVLDGYCHRMRLSERAEKLDTLYRKWKDMPGVQLVKVGYERYGMQSDEEYVEEKQREGRMASFAIKELNWVGERPGGESKKARVERLEPDFRNGKFFVPGRVWHATIDRRVNEQDGTVDLVAGSARWFVQGEERDRDTGKVIKPASDEIHYRPDPGLHELERRAKAAGEHWRLFDPLSWFDEDRNIYDLTRVFFEEYRLFPFSPHDDLIDAISRIYDMEPAPAVQWENPEPEDYPDS